MKGKRHTARRVASPLGGGGYLLWKGGTYLGRGGYPPLPGGGLLWGGDNYLGRWGVSTLAGIPLAPGVDRQTPVKTVSSPILRMWAVTSYAGMTYLFCRGIWEAVAAGVAVRTSVFFLVYVGRPSLRVVPSVLVWILFHQNLNTKHQTVNQNVLNQNEDIFISAVLLLHTGAFHQLKFYCNVRSIFATYGLAYSHTRRWIWVF